MNVITGERSAEQILEEMPPGEPEMGEKTAEQILDELAPSKSSPEYNRAWKRFSEYRAERGENVYAEPGESIYIRYHDYLRSTLNYNAASMWKTYSMLNNNHHVSTNNSCFCL